MLKHIQLSFKRTLQVLLPVVFVLISAFGTGIAPAGKAGQNQAFKLKPHTFYIEGVTDGRTEKRAIALLIPVPGKALSDAKNSDLQTLDLVSVKRYLMQSADVDRNRRPVIINIKKLAVNETALPDGRVDGKLELSFSFELKTGEDMWVHLVNYTSGAHYIRLANQSDVAETTTAKAIDNSLIFFNNWMEKQQDTNPVLAKRVELAFLDYTDDKDADTVYYDAKRPLTWADFKDHPRGTKYAAEIFPGLGYTEKTAISKGVIKLEIAMKVFMPKSGAWVRAANMDDYTLNHEQRHFDITRIISERFKKRIINENLPVLNYDGYINVAYFDALRELDSMQKKYDNETGHGMNAGEQTRWNKIIDNELAAPKSYAAN